MPNSDSSLAWLRAFPAALADDVVVATRALPKESHGNGHCIGLLSLRGENVQIPGRMYNPQHGKLDGLTPLQRNLVACMYATHHDGFVRQRQVAALLQSNEHWSVPFVVQLLSEYVLEIVEEIAASPRALAHPHYAEFVRENPEYWQRSQQRMVSYARCYHRGSYPALRDYPPLLIAARWRAHEVARSPV